MIWCIKKNNTKKRIFEFAVVRVYIEDRLLVFWDSMSHFTHRFIISGPMGYFWILIYYHPPYPWGPHYMRWWPRFGRESPYLSHRGPALWYLAQNQRSLTARNPLTNEESLSWILISSLSQGLKPRDSSSPSPTLSPLCRWSPVTTAGSITP